MLSAIWYSMRVIAKLSLHRSASFLDRMPSRYKSSDQSNARQLPSLRVSVSAANSGRGPPRLAFGVLLTPRPEGLDKTPPLTPASPLILWLSLEAIEHPPSSVALPGLVVT